MDEKKVHRLMDLKDEVKEFHPFLRTLFHFDDRFLVSLSHIASQFLARIS
jgi:hypothetical protein